MGRRIVMSAQWYPVESYKVSLQVTSKSVAAYVGCYSEKKKLEMAFVAPDVKMKPPSFGPDTIKVHVSEDRYPSCVDLLRNEGPIWFVVDEDAKAVALATSKEVPGEGELLAQT
jgi:hypothetical protein